MRWFNRGRQKPQRENNISLVIFLVVAITFMITILSGLVTQENCQFNQISACFARDWWSGGLQNLATEFAGALMTYWIFDNVLKRQQRRQEEQNEKERLISQLGSQMNSETRRAAEELRRNGWGVGADTSLVGADLTGAVLRGVDLREMNLNGVKLADCDLTNTNLNGSQLVNADLSGAELSGVELRGANLRGASLINADLTGAKVFGADFSDSSLLSACLFQIEDDSETCYDGATVPDSDLFFPRVVQVDVEIERYKNIPRDQVPVFDP